MPKHKRTFIVTATGVVTTLLIAGASQTFSYTARRAAALEQQALLEEGFSPAQINKLMAKERAAERRVVTKPLT